MGIKEEEKLLFFEVCNSNGLILEKDQLDRLEHYKDLLLEWNSKINLISRKDEENVWTSHLLHSISPLFKINIVKGASIVDIGTGGGLPGIPMKIVRPDISFLCIDSTGKKIKAVSQMIKDLQLKDIDALWGRAEELSKQKEYSCKFDFAVARAVAPLAELVLWSKDFLQKMPIIGQEEDKIEKYIDPHPPALLVFKGGDLTRECEEASRKYTELKIEKIDLIFKGADQFYSDKKLLIIHS